MALHRATAEGDIPMTPEEEADFLAQQAAGNPTLDDLKAEKNAQINQWREEANFSTFPHGGKVFACDRLSRSDIDGVANEIALNGAFPAGFPHAWKAIDNTYLAIPDIASFKAFYSSMTAQGAVNFAHAQALKAALAAADTPAKVEAIVW